MIPRRLQLQALVALLLLAAAAGAMWWAYRTGVERGGLKARLELAENTSEINRLARRATDSARAEERRQAEQRRSADERAALETAELRAAADRAGDLEQRLRRLQAAHAAAARRVAASAAASPECQAAASAAVVYAELFRLADDAAGRMAQTAGERGIAGAACERAGALTQ